MALAAVIAVSPARIKGKPNQASRRYHVALSLVLLISLFLSLLLIMSATRSSEKRYLSTSANERTQVINDLGRPDCKKLIGSNIGEIANVSLPRNPRARFTVLLTLHSLDCRTCIDEAIYLEYLSEKYRDQISFLAVVEPIGNTAISAFKDKFSITYPIVQDPAILGANIFSKYKSLKILVLFHLLWVTEG